MTEILKTNSSESKFIFTDDYVLKSFPIESGLHYDIAVRLFNYYKKLGMNIEYDVILLKSKDRIGYFITKFPKLKQIPDSYTNGIFEVDELLKNILRKNPIGILENLRNHLKSKMIFVHTRDTKGRNLFEYENKIYLLDIADFYFTIEDKEQKSLPLTELEMAEYKIKHFVYRHDDKYNLPEYVYTYDFKDKLKYE